MTTALLASKIEAAAFSPANLTWNWSPTRSQPKFRCEAVKEGSLENTARKAFDRLLARELEAVLCESKDKAAIIEEPSELWELERFLAQRILQL